ncbi:MAG: sulfate adenylyltransferase subunit CysD [Planctomycetes bacterium]|nr:sulfate adenylyltransferase subunit CysD [Planctomycetota bacterium]
MHPREARRLSSSVHLSHLSYLESESLHVLREVAAVFERPVLLYSIGKDSAVLLHLARKAFWPAPLPFPLLHIDTGYKFPEMIEFRDRRVAGSGVDLRVHRNEAAIERGANPFTLGTQRCCALLKTEALLDALRTGGHDAAIGGARRDEERSRAKERFFSFRDRHGQWDPRNQRPELWNLYNGRVRPGESIRAFPLSNWTELDVWLYIARESVPIHPLYFAREREVIVRGEQLLPLGPTVIPSSSDRVQRVRCRFRTLGCYPCTGAIRSEASSVTEIIQEMITLHTSERSHRAIDHDVDGSMERKKREGYF